MVNAYWEPLASTIREGPAARWAVVIDTSRDPPHDFCEPGGEVPVVSPTYRVECGRSWCCSHVERGSESGSVREQMVLLVSNAPVPCRSHARTVHSPMRSPARRGVGVVRCAMPTGITRWTYREPMSARHAASSDAMPADRMARAPGIDVRIRIGLTATCAASSQPAAAGCEQRVRAGDESFRGDAS
jgi:hypothetical protein